VGGLIPLLPYVFIRTDKHLALLVSLVVTLLALFVFGFFKSKVTGQPPIGGAFRTMIIGATAAGAAFGIAKLVGG
jgi:VIT1/CCC1 family predicted Fe2+/Mn2+ transporter